MCIRDSLVDGLALLEQFQRLLALAREAVGCGGIEQCGGVGQGTKTVFLAAQIQSLLCYADGLFKTLLGAIETSQFVKMCIRDRFYPAGRRV